MKTIKLAAIFAMVAEAILWSAFGLDWWISSPPYKPGIVANVALLFHEPGSLLLGPPAKGSTVVPRLAVIIFTGVVQFFFFAWFIISLRKKLGGKNVV